MEIRGVELTCLRFCSGPQSNAGPGICAPGYLLVTSGAVAVM